MRKKITLFSMLSIFIFFQHSEQDGKIFYDNVFFNSQAQAAETDKNGKDIIQKSTDEAIHFTVVEIIKKIVIYFILPLGSLFIIWLIYKVKWVEERIESIKKKIEAVITKYEFRKIFEEGNQKRLNGQYIKNAIRTARHKNNPEEKKLAIQQLTQFHADSAFDGLIDLLRKEKDETFKYVIIYALYKVVQNRKKNSL